VDPGPSAKKPREPFAAIVAIDKRDRIRTLPGNRPRWPGSAIGKNLAASGEEALGPFAGLRVLARAAESEAGTFEDVSALLERLVPLGVNASACSASSWGHAATKVPFRKRRLTLGRWQRAVLGLGDESTDSMVTLIGR
jgi:hypothetical protein